MKVLLTNDDGPPDSKVSPYVFGLYNHLTALGMDVKVVLPSSQKSWIGKAFHITEITNGYYFYPTKASEGLTGETSPISRPLKDGELAEWILLDGTPSTCANVALHNIYPNQIDLVISGPNLGRNTSSAFAMSSGTLGAALDGALSKTRSIALSYGTFVHPTPETYFEPSHRLSCRIIRYLWDNWGKDKDGLRPGEVDLYSINIPLVEGLLADEGLQIVWTSMWRNSYGRLFKSVPASTPGMGEHSASAAGPDGLTDPSSSESQSSVATQGPLAFKFSPAMEGLIHPQESSLPVGSDAWAMFKGAKPIILRRSGLIGAGYVSVTPLRASFAEPVPDPSLQIEDRVWKL